MADWEREIGTALREGPRWPGDPDRLWQRIEARLPDRQPSLRHRLLAGWRSGPRLGMGALAAAAVLVVAVGLVRFLNPEPFGSESLGTVAAPPALSLEQLRVETEVLGEPRTGSPLRFGVAVTRESGLASGPVRLHSGALEVRSAVGDVVWEVPIPEFSSLDLTGAGEQRAEVTWPAAGDPGHYRAGIRLVAVDHRGAVAELGAGSAELFVPYPPGSVRVGQVRVARTLTRGPVTAALDRLILDSDRAVVHFALRGADLAGGFRWTAVTPDGASHPLLRTDYQVEGEQVVGVAAFEPVPVVVRTLVVRLDQVGVTRDGTQVTELPYTWEWEVPLEPVP